MPKGTSMLPLSGVALHYRVEEVKQVPNGTNTYLLEIGSEMCSATNPRSSTSSSGGNKSKGRTAKSEDDDEEEESIR